MIPATNQLWFRLSAFALFVVIVQNAAISQLSILGVSADVAPLLVASVGLLCGSLTGAAAGFGVGFLVDLLLFQTLGVSSLLLLTVGYGAGRLRELQDPAHGLTPLAVGAAATAVSAVGFSLIQFLLGVDAPVSWLLLRDIMVGILVNTAIAIPAHALVRRVLLPTLPDDPRRRRRRAYTTGGLSPLSRSR